MYQSGNDEVSITDVGVKRSTGSIGTSARAANTVNYLPDDTEEMVSFDVPAVLNQPEKTRRFLQKLCSLENRPWPPEGLPSGMPLSDISRITQAEAHRPSGCVLVLVLKRAIQPKDVLTNVIRGGDWAEQRVGGCTIYSNNLRRGECCEALLFPDNRTVVFGFLKTIQGVLKRDGPPRSIFLRRARAFRNRTLACSNSRRRARGPILGDHCWRGKRYEKGERDGADSDFLNTMLALGRRSRSSRI